MCDCIIFSLLLRNKMEWGCENLTIKWTNLQPEYCGKNPVWWLWSFMVDHGFLASILDRRREEDVVLCFLRHMFLTWLVQCSWNCWSSWKWNKCSTSFHTLVTVRKLSAEPGGFVQRLACVRVCLVMVVQRCVPICFKNDISCMIRVSLFPVLLLNGGLQHGHEGQNEQKIICWLKHLY